MTLIQNSLSHNYVQLKFCHQKIICGNDRVKVKIQGSLGNF